METIRGTLLQLERPPAAEPMPADRPARRNGRRRASEKRTVTRLVRFSPAEFEAVNERARSCGRPLACYLRETALGAVPKVRRTHAADELIRALGRIGNYLNQLAAVANSTGQLPHEVALAEALAELLDAVRRLD